LIDINTFLENSVYYPACGYDGTPIKYLGKLFSNFVYADYNTDYFELENIICLHGLQGYRLKNIYSLDAEELFGFNWEDFIIKNKEIYEMLHFKNEDQFARIFSFDRNIRLNDSHGKRNIELLYIKAEGISTYNYLYVQRNIAPKCLVSIVPGLGFGGNFDDYPKMLINLIKSTKKFPEYQFYDDQGAKYFYELIKYYNEINHYEYKYDRPEWSTNFTFSSLKKRNQGENNGFR
jgi:hypothetical protein